VDGTWRSLVARFLGVEEVAGSNPVVPIRIQTQDERPKTETLRNVIPPTRLSKERSESRSFGLGLLVLARLFTNA
jgi:hypothetical protein